jgi:cyclase
MALSVRIIPILLHRGEQAFKGRRFNSWRSIGHIRNLVRLYNARQVDEIVILDISATKDNSGPNFDLISDLSGDIFSPATFGGGVNCVEHFASMLRSGADKIALNTAAIANPQLINNAAIRFGSQAVVVSVDTLDGVVYTKSGSMSSGRIATEWVRECQDRGAGEIILNSIDRDGMMGGYDLRLISKVATTTSLPVVACGGAGKLSDFPAALAAGAHGVAASSIFAFTEITPADVAEYLLAEGYNARIPA